MSVRDLPCLRSEGEIITPHQTILLKLLDSFLHSQAPTQMSIEKISQLCDHLLRLFAELSVYTQESITCALGPDKARSALMDTRVVESNQSQDQFEDRATILEPTPQLEELDLLLPKVCEALVLVAQCLISLTLWDGEKSSDSIEGATAGEFAHDFRRRVSKSQTLTKVSFTTNLIGVCLVMLSRRV